MPTSRAASVTSVSVRRMAPLRQHVHAAAGLDRRTSARIRRTPTGSARVAGLLRSGRHAGQPGQVAEARLLLAELGLASASACRTRRTITEKDYNDGDNADGHWRATSVPAMPTTTSASACITTSKATAGACRLGGACLLRGRYPGARLLADDAVRLQRRCSTSSFGGLSVGVAGTYLDQQNARTTRRRIGRRLGDSALA